MVVVVVVDEDRDDMSMKLIPGVDCSDFSSPSDFCFFFFVCCCCFIMSLVNIDVVVVVGFIPEIICLMPLSSFRVFNKAI